MISNVNVLSENRSVAFLAISGALARGALGGPHTPGQVGVLYGPQTPGQNVQFISHHSSIIPGSLVIIYLFLFTNMSIRLTTSAPMGIRLARLPQYVDVVNGR